MEFAAEGSCGQNALASRRPAIYEARVLWNVILGGLAGLSAALGLWQWVVALRFPLHQRVAAATDLPGITLLKPIKGCDEFTGKCLRSWLAQDYPGPVQLLFGVASEADPVCDVIRALIKQFPDADASLVICSENLGANAKVSKLVQLQRQSKHDLILISDADVFVSSDLVMNAVQSLVEPAAGQVGLVSCFYRLANPSTPAMRWEAVAINADFWSQVLQSNSLKAMDFALGAVMVVRREALDSMGGFAALADCLADDYQLGRRIVRQGYRAELCPVVVECWDPPQGWAAVWHHQLRWARTIRVCQPGPYFFSILSNATLWPLLWVLVVPSVMSCTGAASLLAVRIALALDLHRRLAPTRQPLSSWLMVLLKDILGAALWVASFLGHSIVWRGRRMQLRRDGTLVTTSSH
jgi:ceramide glucosyltransferase